MRVSDYFDGVYHDHERFWWREKVRYSSDPSDYPTSLLTQLTLRLLSGRAPGRALDIGAGEGSDSIRLALMGYEVDAVELSEVGAQKTKGFAAAAGASVNVVVADAQEYQPSGTYDVVICNGVLQYVRDKDSVIRQMQAATRPGGLNVVSLWSSSTPVPECHQIVPVYPDAEDGVVASSYKAWHRHLFYVERAKPETSHSDMPAHLHSHIKLIAAKP